jgi:hypothetical protein
MRAIGIRGRDASNRARRIRALLAGTALSALTVLPAAAQNATWKDPATVPGPVPLTFDFDAGANWVGGLVPTGTATFDAATKRDLSFSIDTVVDGWTFTTGALNYTFTNGHILSFIGFGITINAGSATIVNNNLVTFNNSSSAGSAAITNNAAAALIFSNSSTAANASITNNSGASTVF